MSELSPCTSLDSMDSKFTRESRANDPPNTASETPLPKAAPVIVLPSIPTAHKSQYTDVPEALVAFGAEFEIEDIDCIIGEHVLDNKLYYFVRFKDGLAHKLLATVFKIYFPSIVRDYVQKKGSSSLSRFDPSSQSIHRDSRVKNTVSISMSRCTSSALSSAESAGQGASASEPLEVPDSEEPSSEDDNDSDFESNGFVELRRSTRAAPTGGQQKTVKQLPYSPVKATRKRRTRNAALLEDSEDELAGFAQDSDIEMAPVRRSQRTAKGVSRLTATDASTDDESDQYEPVQRKKAKRPHFPKASRPAYGHFRPITDLDQEDEDPLQAHRNYCEKCRQKPAHVLRKAYRKRPKNTKKQKRNDSTDDDGEDEDTNLANKGGWVRCLKCPVTAHWACLAATQRDEILKAARDRDRKIWRESQGLDDSTIGHKDEPGKRPGLSDQQTTEFICTTCMGGGICMGCKEVALEVDASILKKRKFPATIPELSHAPEVSNSGNGDIVMTDEQQPSSTILLDEKTVDKEPLDQLLFRCITCKRVAHYAHLPIPPGSEDDIDLGDATALAAHYTKDWECADCVSFTYDVDKILAWRPYPSQAIEPPRGPHEIPNIKSQLPREYLVKWIDRSYRRTQWVPHMWLATKSPNMLRTFLINGPKVEMLAEAMTDAKQPTGNDAFGTSDVNLPLAFEIDAEDSRASSVKPDAKSLEFLTRPSPDAERKIPPAWKTADRVLDILLWSPEKRNERLKKKSDHNKSKGKRKDNARGRRVVQSDDESDVGEINDPRIEAEYAASFNDGEQPSEDLTESVEEFEARKGRKLEVGDADRVIWAFIKWDDLGYDEASWDSPPRQGEFGHAAFVAGFERYIVSRSVIIPKRSQTSLALVENRQPSGYAKFALRSEEQPDLGQSAALKLMPFQIDGFNWLCDNWWNLQHCILADEMGLGKTVQIAAFLGKIVKTWDAWPVLIVVPNSTITNWVREIARWAPGLRVVSFYGGSKGRDIVKKYELRHGVGTTGIKFHVLVTTYETVTNAKDSWTVFKGVPRWEVLVVDEGQRLKNDNSLLFKKLKELTVIHRIIMTGTPLNNNIRELFNLMNFLDPDEWDDLKALEKDYEVLTEELVKQLHHRLRPYFLRRIKSEVLQLPPKNEVIVPVSMTPLQKNVYRSILSKNLDVLKVLTEESRSKFKALGNKTNLKNVLMQLRKCLQHPYLNDRAIEPDNLPPKETHEKLIDAATKLRFLKSLLPKLHARGHRVLLFSQFVIALDIIEDFVAGEGYSFLRMDGNTPQVERQKGMDEFNRPGSKVFIYLLSTRAGGVGINLWSADTVIIHDPDFNPHQDLQAIARSHRYGQTKTCMVFKLMVKDSAEERIIQTGKKKLILDHLIVQKMDDDDEAGENVQSILTYGANALFAEDESARDIVYTDHDIDQLIEKTQTMTPEEETTKDGGLSFSFAKIWAADKDSLEELADDLPTNQPSDSWEQTLRRIETEIQKEKAKEVTGRGVRRKATAAVFSKVTPQSEFELDQLIGPDVIDKRRKSTSKSATSGAESDAYDSSGNVSNNSDDLHWKHKRKSVPVIQQHEVFSINQAPLLKRSEPELAQSEAPLTQQARQTRDPAQAADRARQNGPLAPILTHLTTGDDDDTLCGLCGTVHNVGACFMTQRDEFLVQYRRMLLTHSDDEPLEERRAAVSAIDETLVRRGKIHLIAGQPLLLLENPVPRVQSGKAKPRAKAQAKESMNHTARPTKTTAKRGSFQTTLTSGRGSFQAAPLARLSGSERQIQVDKTEPSVAGPSKRPSSPTPQDSETHKKQTRPCILECGLPAHMKLSHCPVVQAGVSSISKALEKLEGDPAMAATVANLRALLSKRARQNRISTSNFSELIEISD